MRPDKTFDPKCFSVWDGTASEPYGVYTGYEEVTWP